MSRATLNFTSLPPSTQVQIVGQYSSHVPAISMQVICSCARNILFLRASAPLRRSVRGRTGDYKDDPVRDTRAPQSRQPPIRLQPDETDLRTWTPAARSCLHSCPAGASTARSSSPACRGAPSTAGFACPDWCLRSSRTGSSCRPPGSRSARFVGDRARLPRTPVGRIVPARAGRRLPASLPEIPDPNPSGAPDAGRSLGCRGQLPRPGASNSTRSMGSRANTTSSLPLNAPRRKPSSTVA